MSCKFENPNKEPNSPQNIELKEDLYQQWDKNLVDLKTNLKQIKKVREDIVKFQKSEIYSSALLLN